jgi:hypothetical protein
MRSHGLKVLGLSLLAALGLMAITASAAQAELLNDNILVNGNPLGANESKNYLGEVGEGELLTAGGVKIHCENGDITGTIHGDGSGSAHVLYNGCTVVEEPFCEVYETLEDWKKGENEGHILATGKGQVFEHEGNHYLLVEGLGEEKVFADFGFAGELCPLPTFNVEEHQTVTGSTVLALPDALVNQLLHEVQTIDPATLEELFPEDGLFLGHEPAHLAGGTTGSVHLEEVEGEMPTWSVEPS